MGIRTVNGSTSTEDGWPLVDQAGCTWKTIPGCVPRVTVQSQTGIPATLGAAWIADLNAFVEKVRDADTGSWTEGNSVLGGYGRNNGSNHLGGTAWDVDWDDHPMGPAYAGYNQAQIDEIRRMREFYKLPDGTYLIWWAEDWDTPKDSMHFQMGYDTFERQDAINQWIRQNIRPDGFSTYRRGATVTPSDTAAVLAQATGLSATRAAELLPTVISGLQAADCTNVNRIAMWLAQCGEESAGFDTTEEYASGAEYEGRCSDLGNCSPGDGVKYKGRTWIQITGKAHYGEFSQWAAGKGFVPSPTQFVDNPASLGDLKWAGIGAAWYWTVSRPDINALSDQGDVVTVTHRINGGEHGLADRQARYARAHALGDRLLQLLTPATELDEWDQLMADPTQDSSRSCYRNSNDKTMTARDAVFGADATSHMNWVEQAAIRGETWALDAVAATARGQGAGATQWNNPTQIDQWAVGHAQGVLAYIEAVNPAALKAYLGKAAA